jgi:hypothetical protein
MAMHRGPRVAEVVKSQRGVAAARRAGSQARLCQLAACRRPPSAALNTKASTGRHAQIQPVDRHRRRPPKSAVLLAEKPTRNDEIETRERIAAAVAATADSTDAMSMNELRRCSPSVQGS